MLRWFWWRINAWAELAAMVAGFFIGLFTTVVPVLRIDDFGLRLLVITAITSAVWITAMLVTPPESDEVLERFFRKIRPGGTGLETPARGHGSASGGFGCAWAFFAPWPRYWSSSG